MGNEVSNYITSITALSIRYFEMIQLTFFVHKICKNGILYLSLLQNQLK